MLQTKNKPLLITALALAALLVGLIAVALLLPGPSPEPEAPTETTPPETTLAPVPSNPYSAEDFTTEDDRLTLSAGSSMYGIDVSFWQGDIDWQQVRDSGVEFAMLRIGRRGTESGELAEDIKLRQNYAGATEAGILVGGYFFSQAITVAEAIEEADYVLSIIDGWTLDLPIVYDWEYMGQSARTANVDARLLTDCTKAFCQRIEDAGYESMIYFNADQSHKQMYLAELTQYRFWLALYESEMDYPYKIDMWQYSNTGTVPGISTPTDQNLLFLYD